MTYFQFLLIFLGTPILVFTGLNLWDMRRRQPFPSALGALPAWLGIMIHIVLAVLYTTPWDNYLVATGVWFYNPSLVSGQLLGWVPVEEYTFFVLQTILAGLVFVYFSRRLQPAASLNDQVEFKIRSGITTILGTLWILGVSLLASRWAPGTYLGLILIWALPPIILQMIFGAHVLWIYRRLVLGGIFGMTVYLSAADSLAIRAGTWTIDPSQSLHVFVGYGLPLEEFLFFMVTNSLIFCGLTLVLHQQSPARFREVLKRANDLFQRQNSLPS